MTSYQSQIQDNIDKQLAEANHVISIQNDWMACILACPLPKVGPEDCAVCQNPECKYAYEKLQTLWPEIENWPPQPKNAEVKP